MPFPTTGKAGFVGSCAELLIVCNYWHCEACFTTTRAMQQKGAERDCSVPLCIDMYAILGYYVCKLGYVIAFYPKRLLCCKTPNAFCGNA